MIAHVGDKNLVCMVRRRHRVERVEQLQDIEPLVPGVLAFRRRVLFLPFLGLPQPGIDLDSSRVEVFQQIGDDRSGVAQDVELVRCQSSRLVELRRYGIDVHEGAATPRLRSEHLRIADGSVVESRSQRENEVGMVGGRARRIQAVHAEHPEIVVAPATHG